MDSGSNYISISEPTVVKLNQMLETETDPVILARYRKELMEHLGPIIAFVNTLVLVNCVQYNHLAVYNYRLLFSTRLFCHLHEVFSSVGRLSQYYRERQLL